MSEETVRSGAAVYELTVRGELGPVLRGAIRPFGGVRTEELTILRAGSTGDRDVVELLRQLDVCGLDIREVTRRAGPVDELALRRRSTGGPQAAGSSSSLA